MTDFWGAKLALFIGTDLLVYLRDDKPSIPFPNMWDFPGGGREGQETPFETAQRETKEEFSLDITKEDVCFSKEYPSWRETRVDWFLIAKRPKEDRDLIVFGDEGQKWQLMPLDEYLNHPNGISHLKSRLKENVQFIE